MLGIQTCNSRLGQAQRGVAEREASQSFSEIFGCWGEARMGGVLLGPSLLGGARNGGRAVWRAGPLQEGRKERRQTGGEEGGSEDGDGEEETPPSRTL